MLYAEFHFRMKRRDAVCIVGWTSGPVEGARLVIGKEVISASVVLVHQRGDLPPDACGFILRFDLRGESPDPERTWLELPDPDLKVPFPNASAGLDALLGSALDEVLISLMIGLAKGVLEIEDKTVVPAIHARARVMAEHFGFTEVKAAAVAVDHAGIFSDPSRVLVTGWMADDQEEEVSSLGLVIDCSGLRSMIVHRDSYLRPDLASVHMRTLKLGITSGFVATLRSDTPIAPDAVVLVGMTHGNTTFASLRHVVQQAPVDLARQYEAMKHVFIDPQLVETALAAVLPAMPDHASAAKVPSPNAEQSGVAYLVEHDLDHWLGRDTVRLVRRAEPDLARMLLLADATTEGLIRSTRADRAEAGSTPPAVELASAPSSLSTWAPKARHLVVSTAATLFQTRPFETLAKARAEGLPAICLILSDEIESAGAEISAEEAIAALVAGQPFTAQIDQGVITPAEGPGSAQLSHLGQMRWLMVSLARLGLLTFVGGPGLGFLAGRDPVPLASRLIELQAMKTAIPEART